MKSQDIGLLLKLRSMEIQEKQALMLQEQPLDDYGWADWNVAVAALSGLPLPESRRNPDYTARGLELETGISKTQINLSLKRCMDIGLAFRDRQHEVPRANAKALLEFLVYAVRYVFPARKGELTRGIGTAFSAPALRSKLLNAGEMELVWPDAYGKSMGQSVEPLFKSAPHAVKRDPVLYELLALVDALRLGQPRERKLATELLEARLLGQA